jgi:hypothetical protein
VQWFCAASPLDNSSFDNPWEMFRWDQDERQLRAWWDACGPVVEAFYRRHRPGETPWVIELLEELERARMALAAQKHAEQKARTT